MGQVERYPNGTFCWIDVGTTAVAGAKAFYGGLFGWEFEDQPAGEGDAYTLCRLQGRDVAGIHRHDPDEGIGWASSIAVDDLEAVTSRARELGATVLAEPFDVPGAGRTAVLRDPSGAVVSLWQPRGHAGAGLVNEVGDLDLERAGHPRPGRRQGLLCRAVRLGRPGHPRPLPAHQLQPRRPAGGRRPRPDPAGGSGGALDDLVPGGRRRPERGPRPGARRGGAAAAHGRAGRPFRDRRRPGWGVVQRHGRARRTAAGRGRVLTGGHR
jgi:predicted enzyme related to lactoylglutathione lyase